MPKWLADEKAKKKKEEEKKAGATQKPQSSSSSKTKTTTTEKVASKSTFMGGGTPVRKVEEKVKGPSAQKLQQLQSRTSNTPTSAPRRTTPQRQTDTGTGRHTYTRAEARDYNNNLKQNRIPKRTTDTSVVTRNTAEWNTVKNRSRNEQQEWFTRKAREAQERHAAESGREVDRGTDNLLTSAVKAAYHSGKGAVHSLSGAIERSSMNDFYEAARFKYDAMRKGVPEEAAEKLGNEKAQKRQQERLAGFRQKSKIEQEKAETIKSEEAAKDVGLIPLRKWTVGAASFTGQRLVDTTLAGPYSLLSMGARVLEDERNSGKEQADQLKKRLMDSGQFSKEELDEEFSKIDKRTVGNAYLSSGIEILSEMLFRGVGLSKSYLPEGAAGIFDRAASKLAGRFGRTALGRIGMGIAEETLEEWIANPSQAATFNALVGNRMQSLQEEGIRRAYQSQARDLKELHATSADINSQAFLDRAKEIYKEAGASDEESSQIAELARDYFNAEITGDTETAQKKLNQISDILAGGENDLRQKWTLKDAIEVAGEMIISVGAEATPGAISTMALGNQYKSNYGMDGVRKLAKIVENLDEERSDAAKAIVDDIDNGKDLSGTQVAMLMEWSNDAALKAQDRELTRDRLVQKKMRDERLLVPIVDNEYNLAPATEERFESIVERVADMAQDDMKLNMNDVDAYAVGDVVAAFETGTISAEQMNELNIENPENRAVFEAATGIDLNQYTIKDAKGNIRVAASNAAMQKALFAKAADNYMESARIEQENWNDVERGRAFEELTSNMDGMGGVGVQRVLEAVDPRNRSDFLLAGSVARRVYEHARFTNDSWDQAKNKFVNAFNTSMDANMKYVFDMAKEAKAIDETANYGKKVTSGENMKNSLGQERQVIVPGTVVDLRSDQSDKRLSEKSFFTKAATTFGVNIELVDNLPMVDAEGNVVIDEKTGMPVQVEGVQIAGSRTIRVNTHQDIQRSAREIVMHELIHQIRSTAPDAFKRLANHLMDRMYKSDPEGFTQNIKSKQAQYAKVDPNISIEGAFEEMLANGFVEIDWNKLIEDVNADVAITSEEKASFFDSLKNAFREILRKLRSMLASGDVIDPEAQKALQDEILLADETYNMLLIAATASKADQAQQAIDDWQDKANKQNDIRLSVPTDSEYMAAVEALPTEDEDYFGRMKGLREIQKMVDEKAIENGYNIKAYHGTDSEPFNVFDRDKLRHGRQYGDGFYFSPYEEYADTYGNETREYYLKANGMTLDELFDRPAAQEHRDFDNKEDALKFSREKRKQFEKNGQGIERFRPESRRVNGKYHVTYTTIGSFQNNVILVATEPEYIKSADPITYDDNGNVIPLSQRFDETSKDTRFSISANLDEPYMDAVNSGNMDEAQRLVDEAALQMPNVAKAVKGRLEKPIPLYHGTRFFGFTEFKDERHEVPFIYTSTNRSVSAHYAGDQHYAFPRPIGKPYREGDSVEDIIENAETVWQSNYHVMTSDEKKARCNEVIDEAKKIADKIDELDVPFDSFADGDDYSFANAVDNVKYLFWISRDMDDEFYYNFDEDNGYREEAVQYHQDAVDGFERNIEKVREYYFENRKSLTDDQKKLLSYLISYEVGDAAIDMRSALKVMTEEDRLINEYGNINIPSGMKEAMDEAHNIASYELYGDLGENPFEFDANGAQWYGLKVPEVSDDYTSTDAVCKWAYEHGYTSVIMHNIYDYGDKADNYVFFNSGQLKSADTVTYAEDGSVIPLSERFDPTNNDIRYSLPTTDAEGNILTDGQMEYFQNSQARDEQGRLVPVYHTTNYGGFTIFDPSYSDDKRSLFFASNWDVSQTYGRNANTKFEFDENADFATWSDFEAFARITFKLSDSDSLAREFDISVRDANGSTPYSLGNSNDAMFKSWLSLAENSDSKVKGFIVSMTNPYTGEQIQAKSLRNLLLKLEDTMLTHGQTKGYYQCYLNLENPLIINANGQNWSSILEDGFSKVDIKVWYQGDGMYSVDAYPEKELTLSEIEDIYGEVVANEIKNTPMDMWEFYNGIQFSQYRYNGEYFNPEEEGYPEEGNTRYWAQYAQHEGYDGVIFRDLRDIGGASSLKGNNPMSDIYIAFSSNQVKDVNNVNPTENPDIRYSITSDEEAMEWLATQYELDDVPLEDQQAEEGRIRMAKSKKDFVNSINTKWNERWLTEGKVLDVKSVRKNIKDLVTGIMFNADTDHKYNGKVVDNTLIDAKSAYWLMKEGKHGEAAELLWDSAVRMIENVDFIDDTTFKQYKDLRDYMRTTSFRLGEEYWSDVDYQAFRKRNFGRIKLVKGDTNIDELYQELQERWPEWFNEEEQMTAPDQLLHIEEVLDAIQPYKIAYTSEEAEQLAGDVADTLYDIVYQGTEYKSIADTYKEKYDAKTKALKARHQEALAKVRAEGDLKVRKERAKFKEYKEQKKNAKEKAKHIGRISDNIDWLTTRLLKETKDKNIPEGFRKSLAHMLMQFDMQTERSKKLEEKYGPAKKTLQMRELKDKLAQIAKEDDTGEFRYDGYLFYLMDALAEKVDGQVIDSLDTEDLIAIDTMLKSIVHNFRNYNKIRVEEEKVAIANIGDNIINAMDERIKKYGKRKSYDKSARGYLDRLVNEGEETPIYLFERLDPKGNGIGAMYKELRRGEDRHIRNMNFLRNRFKAMFSEYSNKNKSGSKLEEWRDTSQAQTFNLENGSITLNPAQIMSLYCLSKRPQAMGHILGSGIVATSISFGAKLNEKFKGNEEQVDSVMITYSELQEIISTLTEDQARLADEMQALMNNEMAAWGNEVSLELHGIKLFRETDYFPIKASNEVLQKTAENRDVQEKIKNFGFTKPLTRNANNAIMIDDIFSVVADHCNKMSLYNSMAIPITDFMRVYNYTQKNEGGKTRTVQAAIGEAFTRKVNDYIMKFIADVNGNTKTRSDAVDDLMNKALANYKKASIGFNARVALQQPTAIFRSLMVIDAKYFKGTRLVSPEDQREMFEHCPIALWKSWGHYDMDMGRDIEDIMMNNDQSAFDTVTMGAYGWLDNMAWGKIWQAVKNEVKDKHPDVKVGSNAFFRLCNERASEIYDKTQVVDSIFHRSDTMRSKNTLTKMATSFMAEPTLTYNVFRDSIVKANELKKDGNKEEANKLLFKMMFVLTLNAAAVSGAAAIWDAVRGKGDDDDEDDENLLEKGLMKLVTRMGGSDPWAKEDKSGKDLWLINFLNNFVDNAPWAQWNNIYFVKDIISLKDGWGTSNMALEGWETLFKGFSQAHKKITKGSKTSWYDIDMNIAGGIGYLFGWPIKTFMRDAKSLLEKAGIEVFAADDTETEAGLMDSLANKLKFTVKEEPTEKKSKKEQKTESAEYDAKVEEYRESLSDNYSENQKDKLVKQYKKQLDAESEPELPEGFSVKEHAQQGITDFEFEMEKRSLKAAENAAGKTGNARNNALWDVIAEGYTKSVESGNMATIQAMRDAFVANGGDAEWFDQKITDKMKSAYKKTINTEVTPGASVRQDNMLNYLTTHGVTDQEISEIVRSTATAKDLKAALRMGVEEYILDELTPLVRAGLTRADFEYLYKYRNYGAKQYDGKYTDPKYMISTGKFNWPASGTISSHFGWRNDVSSVGGSRNHPAIDIAMPVGTPVAAADGGTVIYAGSNGGYGNSVGIQHDNGMVTYYNHLDSWCVNVGDRVGQGMQIAASGNTGRSTGPHLDFKILDADGNPVDPEKYLSN